MLGHRLRRWPVIKPTLGQCLEFAGIALNNLYAIDHSMLIKHIVDV